MWARSACARALRLASCRCLRLRRQRLALCCLVRHVVRHNLVRRAAPHFLSLCAVKSLVTAHVPADNSSARVFFDGIFAFGNLFKFKLRRGCRRRGCIATAKKMTSTHASMASTIALSMEGQVHGIEHGIKHGIERSIERGIEHGIEHGMST